MDKENVYIVLDSKKSISTNADIYIKDIAKVSSRDTNKQKKIGNIKIYKSKEDEDWDYINADAITDKVLEKHKDINVNMLGSPQILLEIKSLEKKTNGIQFLKVLAICIVLFLGSGISIISFHEDVNMGKSLEKIHYTITGEKKNKPLLMTIPYSIGIGVGVITFFSRIISKSRRRRKEPGPMEIELFLYNKDMEEYILNELIKDKTEDKT